MANDSVSPEWISSYATWTYPGDTRPEDDQPITDHSYIYLGYLVTSDAEAEVFAAAYEMRLGITNPFNDDIEVADGTGYLGGNRLYRFRNNMAECLTERHDISQEEAENVLSRAPVLIQRPHNQNPPGGIVAYYDGQIAFVEYPGEFPMTERFMNAVKKMDTIGVP